MHTSSSRKPNSNKSPNRSVRTAAALAIAGALGAGIASYSGSRTLLAQEAGHPSAPNAQQREAIKYATGLSDAFKFASQTMAPSVVNIRSTQHAKPLASGNSRGGNQGAPGMQQQIPDDLLRRFFGEGGPGMGGPEGFSQIPNQPPQDRVGEGTGVILRENGYIVTNNHVVAGADELLVTLDDEREYPATLVGTDPDTDLAVVKIDAAGLVAATFGDSDEVDVGEWVIAMGSPFGLQHTVTAGIVSAKGRANMGLATFEDFIQTDAAINPGNSGGPLLNLEGQLVGINTAISTRSGSNAGIGFAIPSSMVRNVFENIVDNGTVKRGALGVGIEPLTKDQAEYFGYEGGTDGVVISQVYPGSAADKAGLQVGDIITKINGKKTQDNRILLNAIAKHAPGDSIELTVFRHGKTLTLEATLGDRTAQFARNGEAGQNGGKSGGAKDGEASPSGELGLSVEEMTEEIAQQLNAGERKGVVISAVEPGSSAAGKGLQRGDLITMVGQSPIASMEDYEAALKDADLSKGIALQVFRGEQARLVVLKPAKSE